MISKFHVLVVILYATGCNIQNNTFCPYTAFIYLICIVYGEVDSVKNTTINIWLNDGVY